MTGDPLDRENPAMLAAFRAHVASLGRRAPREFLNTSNRRRVPRGAARSAYWMELLACFKYGWDMRDEEMKT